MSQLTSDNLLQETLLAITPEVMRAGIKRAMAEDIVHHAPLGYGGEYVYLYGSSRVSSVSIRNHSGLASLLITDARGGFLFYGQMPPKLSLEKVTAHFHASLLAVQAFVEL